MRVASEYGGTLPGAYACVNRRGVPHGGTGSPRRHPGRQRPPVTGLLAALPRRRELSGVTPQEFGTRARADRALGALRPGCSPSRSS
ncbi:hypothetical protein ACFWHW_25720 [Streptomyces pharetrae]|uniref:hypothetical protein n=1 Tax=Streptomyces pharetrae TaxID=291370 RepID=UPI00364A0F9D